ncbi:methyl-accepting chemotaxis protein [Pseudobutyrivibrio xylanivorans]|uniref:HAMP domain-containing protein n=1 Tax=Pseudobutyrivibrio xylanivorans TaxID=185007 RepID=A0A5P6VSG3_PSEXY|nr:methyl-accepting chemotaxis protein [Pseudobutyrivibrio xylanivorans]QFJ54144.1 HAMP domain-containing protein [Pseudobutyrivibrio xylanivorans]
MARNENKVKSSRTVPMHASIRFRVMSTVGIAVFIAVTAILLVVTIPVRKELLSVNSDYLYMTAQMYGQRMETAVNLTQYDIDIRKVPFRLESFLQNAKMADCESSYCYLVRSDGITLYHPNHDKIGRTAEVEAIKNIATSLGSGNASDIVEYNIDGQDEIAAYYASSKGFVLVVAVEKADFLATLNKMTMIAIITGVVIFVVMLSFGLYQALRITKPIETVAEVVDQIGDLDFTGDERTGALLTRKDETGVIAESVEEMREKLVGIVQKIQSQSTILYNTSQDLYQSARDTNDDASHIEQAVGDIATGASSQADETQKANVDVGVIGEMIIDTSNQVSELTETANNMRNTSEEAFNILEDLSEINKSTFDSIERIYEQTNETNEAAQKIKEVTQLIADIASETNLLSLNASIEAARAGEAGKGFAVVASEISKLAAESSESAKSIDLIIQELVANSSKAVEIMDEVMEVMQQQSKLVEDTEHAFRIVQDGIDTSLESAEQIRQRADRLNVARENIVNTVISLSAIAEENAASSQETSDTMTNIINQLKSVADGSDKLNDIAKILDESINEIHI